MDKITANLKKYENVVIQHNPHVELMKDTVPLVKEFIRKRGLLLYGGTAIDYALRLKGDCIYPDEALDVPDLDFYSPNHAEDAYDLADILYQLGYKETRAFRAMYVLAMRVDIGGNNIVADIGYIHADIFSHIPYIEYEGMRCMHPHYQMIDTHSSLSFPFDNAPREVIFNRWRKDITRYNKLYSHYPLPKPKQNDILAPNKCVISRRFSSCVFMGFAGYALLYQHLKSLLATSDIKMPKDIISADFELTEKTISIDTVGNDIHFIHIDIGEFTSKYIPDVKTRAFYPYKDIIPKRIEATLEDKETNNDVNLHVFDLEKRLVGVASVDIGDASLRIVGAQHMLMFMMIRYNTLTGKQSSTAVAYYLSILKIIETAEQLAKTMPADEQSEFILNSPFFPLIKMYGKDNYSDTVDSLFSRTDERIIKKPQTPTPSPYEPARGKSRPVFEYEKSKYFNRGGKQITKQDKK